MSRKLNRRDIMKLLTAGTGGLVVEACTPQTVTVIETVKGYCLDLSATHK